MTIDTGIIEPDTDDDGLADGRELEAPFHTDPLDPDTDDDGYWHGWIGVRGYETKSARRRRKP